MVSTPNSSQGGGGGGGGGYKRGAHTVCSAPPPDGLSYSYGYNSVIIFLFFFFLWGFFPAVIQSPNFVAAVSLTLSFSFFLFCSIVFSRNEN